MTKEGILLENTAYILVKKNIKTNRKRADTACLLFLSALFVIAPLLWLCGRQGSIALVTA